MILTADSFSRVSSFAEAVLHSLNGATEDNSQGLQFRIGALICLMGVAKGPMEKCLIVICLNYKWK